MERTREQEQLNRNQMMTQYRYKLRETIIHWEERNRFRFLASVQSRTFFRTERIQTRLSTTPFNNHLSVILRSIHCILFSAALILINELYYQYPNVTLALVTKNESKKGEIRESWRKRKEQKFKRTWRYSAGRLRQSALISDLPPIDVDAINRKTNSLIQKNKRRERHDWAHKSRFTALRLTCLVSSQTYLNLWWVDLRWDQE